MFAIILYVRNFRFLWNAFRLQNHIVSMCMDMALDNSNTCIGYKLAFYRYMYSIVIIVLLILTLSR